MTPHLLDQIVSCNGVQESCSSSHYLRMQLNVVPDCGFCITIILAENLHSCYFVQHTVLFQLTRSNVTHGLCTCPASCKVSLKNTPCAVKARMQWERFCIPDISGSIWYWWFHFNLECELCPDIMKSNRVHSNRDEFLNVVIHPCVFYTLGFPRCQGLLVEIHFLSTHCFQLWNHSTRWTFSIVSQEADRFNLNVAFFSIYCTLQCTFTVSMVRDKDVFY